MTTDTQWDNLIDAYLDGTISQPELQELSQWLKQSQQNADRFAERSYLHSHLFDWAKSQPSEALVQEVLSDSTTPRAHSRRSAAILWPLALATAIAILIGGIAWLDRPVAGDPVAQLSDAPGAKVLYHGKALDLSEETLLSGEYQIDSGLLEVRYASGVEILFESPATFRLDSPTLITLLHGRVSAVVPPEGIGFTIDTPSAEVIDYGTEFAVDVADDLSSEVHVFSGEVEVKPLVENADPVRLHTAAATRVEYESEVPLGIPLDEQRFFRSLSEPGQRHSQVVLALDPSLYFRMAVPRDGVSILDRVSGSDGVVITRGSRRPPFAPGKIGTSGRFDGPRDGAFVFVPDYPKATSSELSGSLWVQATSLARKGTIISNASHHKPGQFELSLVRDSGRLALVITDDAGQKIEARTEQPFPIGSWHHVAFSIAHSEIKLYIDGTAVAHATHQGLKTTQLPPALGIGARPNERKQSANNFWHGRIDEVALFNHTLSADDIASLYINSEPKQK